MLKQTELNFIGNIEAREIPNGAVDVIVCDGFTGNTILKLTEGLASFIMKSLKENMMSTTRGKIGGLLLKLVKNLRINLTILSTVGAPFLGIRVRLIKAHGSSDAKAIKNAIRQGLVYLEQDVDSNIEKEINRIATIDEGD